MVSPILSRAGVLSFEAIIQARAVALGPLLVSIDGGAGWGDTAKKIIDATADEGVVHAFEPFPGNHRFFVGCDPRIRLHKVAIADKPGSAKFLVPKIVQPTDSWGVKGLAGYSSIGYLENARDSPAWKKAVKSLLGAVRVERPVEQHKLEVEVKTIESAIPERHVDFLKFDLQGAELKALIGMGDLLSETDMLWIEFSNQPGLFDFLVSSGFLLFDTNYLCVGASNSDLAKSDLEGIQSIVLSTSQNAVLARRLIEQSDYISWFKGAQRSAGVWQTDLLCINPNFIHNFFKILGAMELDL